MTPLAESASRPDWFRLAAQRVNALLNRVSTLETTGVSVSGGSFTLDDGSASGGGGFDIDDGGA